MRVEFPVVSFFYAILVLIPLPSFWRTRTSTILVTIGWLALTNVIRGINTIVWSGTVVVKYPVWCDITTKLAVGTFTAIPALMLCLCRSFMFIVSGKNAVNSVAEKRQSKMLSLFAGIALPILHMASHYVVQGHRFDVYEDFGCLPAIYLCIPAIFIVFVPPFVLAFGAMTYAGITLVYLMRRRKELLTGPRRSQSSLTPHAYLRLVAFLVTQMLLTTSCTIFLLTSKLGEHTIQPWVNWEWVHADWWIVSQYPNIYLSEATQRFMVLQWYMPCLTSVVFFAFFGCGRAVWVEYLRAWEWVRQRAFWVRPGLQPALPLSSQSGFDIIDSTITGPTPATLEYETTAVEERNNLPKPTRAGSQPPSPVNKPALDR